MAQGSKKAKVINGLEYVSQTNYAKHRGCAPKTVFRAVQSAKLNKSLKVIGNMIYIQPKLADQEWAGSSDPSYEVRKNQGTRIDLNAKPKQKEGNETSVKQNQIYDHKKTNDEGEVESDQSPLPTSAYQEHRTQREEYTSKMSRLKYEEKIGALIPRDRVEKEAFEMAQKLQKSILNIPARLAAQLAACKDRGECEMIMERELRIVLIDVAA